MNALPEGQRGRDRGAARRDRIARRLRAVVSAEASEARVTRVLESMSMAFCSLDHSWRYTYVNARAEQVLGMSRHDLLGGSLWELFPSAVGSEFEVRYREAMEERKALTFEAYYPPPLDSWFELTAEGSDEGLAVYFTDVTARRNDREAAELAGARLAGLAQVALALVDAEDVTGLLTVITEQGLSALGCDGGAVTIPDPDDATALRSYVTSSYGPGVQADYARLPLSDPRPACVAFTTGRRVLIADRDAALAFSPIVGAAVEATGSQCFAAIPLRSGAEVIGVVTAGWARPQPFDTEQLDLLETFAAQCAQVLARLAARDAERAASRAASRFSETLQRSLLTSPPQQHHLEIAVRYAPAAAQAQVGGDWYDAFVTREGSTSLVIGDVTGHDQQAAAAMGQLRNLLRGIGYSLGQPPAAVLTVLDAAVSDLAVTATATVVLARLEPPPTGGAVGARVLRWSNAGHPPPLLLEPDGTVRFLETPPDLLIGVDASTPRHDHTVVLEPGATVLLYTDGLIERRGVPLEAGMAWLADTVGHLGAADLDELCQQLLTELGRRVEDDIALLALRARP